MANPLFPTALYLHRGLAADQHLTQEEWNQVGVEVEALEKTLNSVMGNPANDPDAGIPGGVVTYAEISWGRTEVKGRLLDISAAANLQIRTNFKEDGTADNNTWAGWALRLGASVDEVNLWRREPGTGAVVEVLRQTKNERLNIFNDVYISNPGAPAVPVEKLDVLGAIRLSDARASNYGTIAYDTSVGRFKGYNNTGWVYLDITDVVGSGGLPPTGVTADTYGDSSHIAQFTVAVDGRITAASEIAISTGIPPSGPAGGNLYPLSDLRGYYPDPSLTLTGVTAGTYGGATSVPVLAVDAEGRIVTASQTDLTVPTAGPGGGRTLSENPSQPPPLEQGPIRVAKDTGWVQIWPTTDVTAPDVPVTASITGEMVIAGSVVGAIRSERHIETAVGYDAFINIRIKVGGTEIKRLQRGKLNVRIPGTLEFKDSYPVEVPFYALHPVTQGTNYVVTVDARISKDDDLNTEIPTTWKLIYNIEYVQVLLSEGSVTAMMIPTVTVDSEGRITAISEVPAVGPAAAVELWQEHFHDDPASLFTAAHWVLEPVYTSTHKYQVQAGPDLSGSGYIDYGMQLRVTHGAVYSGDTVDYPSGTIIYQPGISINGERPMFGLYQWNHPTEGFDTAHWIEFEQWGSILPYDVGAAVPVPGPGNPTHYILEMQIQNPANPDYMVVWNTGLRMLSTHGELEYAKLTDRAYDVMWGPDGYGGSHRYQTANIDKFYRSGGASTTNWVNLGTYKMTAPSGQYYTMTPVQHGVYVDSPIRAWRLGLHGKFTRTAGAPKLIAALRTETDDGTSTDTVVLLSWTGTGVAWATAAWFLEVDIHLLGTPWGVTPPAPAWDSTYNVVWIARLDVAQIGSGAQISTTYLQRGTGTFTLVNGDDIVLSSRGGFDTADAGNLVETGSISLELR